MKLLVKKSVASLIGFQKLVPFGVSEESWRTWREEQLLDLGKLPPEQIDALEALLTKKKDVKGVASMLMDVTAWRTIQKEGAGGMKARTVRQFESLLEQYLLKVPGHRIYKRHAEGANLAYYVSEVQYHPPVDRNGQKSPPYVSMNLIYEAIGGTQTRGETFHDSDCRHLTVTQALVKKGYVIETPELREEYLAVKDRWVDVAHQIGKQFWAHGVGAEDGDRYSRSRNINLEHGGELSRVVVDVFFEDGKAPKGEGRVDLSPFFWGSVADPDGYDPETDEEEREVDLEAPEIEVPIHPWVIVFHLAKHLRCTVHVQQLNEYVYDEHMADKLVLPAEQKQLVQLLIATQGGNFVDIVKGKGGGAVVLLSGEPGTGKTLTAEVYAESEQRPLYSVQCSQLGVDPSSLEAALLEVFDRARRWNAVMLLDEADVYVHERGNSMEQNAIVGVFLRVLEYQATILFLTTNRPEDVDDAIASRCIARLFFEAPEPEDAKRIWRVLADTSGRTITDKVIDKVVAENPGMTGRDIKNILKLAGLMEGASDGITPEAVRYVQQFKPTGALARRHEGPKEDA